MAQHPLLLTAEANYAKSHTYNKAQSRMAARITPLLLWNLVFYYLISINTTKLL